MLSNKKKLKLKIKPSNNIIIDYKNTKEKGEKNLKI